MAVQVATSRPKKGMSETLKNYWVDVLLFVAFVIDMNTHFTGIAIHEWLGILFAGLMIYHILLHWTWITSLTTRFRKQKSRIQQMKYIINVLLFIDMVIITVTGIWISRVAVGQIGLEFAPNHFWEMLHRMSADSVIWLLGLHLAFDWKWIVNTTKKYVVGTRS